MQVAKSFNSILLSLALLLICGQASVVAQGQIEARFRALDKNADGVLSPEESDRPLRVFKRIDKDSSNTVTLAEVIAYFRPPATLPDGDAEPFESFGKFTDEMPVSLASCRAAADYSTSSNGHAILVLYDDDIVYEAYANGWEKDKPHRLASGTKSFAGVSAAALIQDRLLQLDEKISDTIPEWKHDSRRDVTVRQLLTLTSGVDPGDNQKVLPYADAIQSQVKHEPGEMFEYGPNPFQVYGEFVRRKLSTKKMSYLDYLRSRIFEPIDMNVGFWRETDDGDPHVPSGAFLAAREWAKFGQLLHHGGQWGQRTIIPRRLMDELTQGTMANARYGITFWLSAENDEHVPSDMFMAAGAGKQRLLVIRSLKLVVVRFGESKGKQFQDDEFLKRLLLSSEAP